MNREDEMKELLDTPPLPSHKPWYKRFGLGGAVTVLLAILKWKTILSFLQGIFFLFKFSKFGLTTVSMFAMIGVYAWFYGIWWAVGFVSLITVHEYGHMYAAKRQNIPVTAPVFIPFLGALIGIKEPPKDAATESIIAYGGPLFGFLAAGVVHTAAYVVQSTLLFSLAFTGYLLTLFNLIPASPLDGGRIASAVSPYIWFLGIPLIGFLIWFSFSPILVLVLLAAIHRAWEFWKHRNDSYYDIDPGFRLKIGIAYLALLLASGVLTYETHLIAEALRPRL
ncbi:Peptidase family M50 [Sporomusa ovata DSM 2662]|nr:site-2 protease family protein [Sporomusa ovata]EQB25159.1 peptidase M50 [Sporomusa ovata DSM 2662]